MTYTWAADMIQLCRVAEVHGGAGEGLSAPHHARLGDERERDTTTRTDSCTMRRGGNGLNKAVDAYKSAEGEGLQEC